MLPTSEAASSAPAPGDNPGSSHPGEKEELDHKTLLLGRLKLVFGFSIVGTLPSGLHDVVGRRLDSKYRVIIL